MDDVFTAIITKIILAFGLLTKRKWFSLTVRNTAFSPVRIFHLPTYAGKEFTIRWC
jgi:hypothetical protein